MLINRHKNFLYSRKKYVYFNRTNGQALIPLDNFGLSEKFEWPNNHLNLLFKLLFDTHRFN